MPNPIDPIVRHQHLGNGRHSLETFSFFPLLFGWLTL